MNAPVVYNRDVEHLNILSICHYVLGALASLGVGFLGVHFLIFKTVLSNPAFLKQAKQPASPPEFLAILKWFYLVMGLWIGLSCIFNLCAGYFLSKHRHRTFTFVAAATNCLHIPFGTLLGVFTFLVLSRPSVVALYESGGIIPVPENSQVPLEPIREGDATGGIIPYKNIAALVAYYCGVFSLIPFCGIFVGIPAFILGIVGLKKKKAHPAISGTVHAWIGIIVGGLSTCLWIGLIGLFLFAELNSGSRVHH